MKHVNYVKRYLSQPWLISVILCALIPAFPEYFAPFIAIGALVAAYYETKLQGTRFKIGTVGKIIIAYILYISVGMIYTINLFSTVSTIGMWLSMFAVYLSLTTVITDKQRLDSAIFCICIIAGLVGLIGVGEYLAKAVFKMDVSMSFWGFADSTVFSNLPMRVLFSSTGHRASSTFNNPNIFAEYLIMVIPFVGYYAFDGKRTRTSILCRFCLLISVAGVAVSFSRGSYLALVAIAGIFFLTNIRKITSMIMFFAMTILLIPDSVITRFVSVGSGDSSITGRYSIWHAGIKAVGSHPVLGYGAGTGTTWDVLIQSSIDAPHMHNIFLQLLVEGGVFALAAFVLIFWKLLHLGLDLFFKDKESRNFGVAFLAFLAAFVLAGMVDFPLMTPKLVGVFLMMMALADVIGSMLLSKKMTSIEKESLPFAKLLQKTESRASLIKEHHDND